MDKTILLNVLGDEGFQDLRYQRIMKTAISVKKREIEEVSVIQKSGGHARALLGGCFGMYSFNTLDNMPYALRQSIEASKLISGQKRLAKVPVVKKKISVSPKADPREISVQDKKELVLKYCNMLMDFEGIIHAEGDYYEQFSEKIYVNNEGTEIEQEELICGIKFSITSKKNGLTQQTRLSLGGSQNYEDMMGKEEVVMEKAKQTLDLLSAKPVAGGIYDVILDSDVGGLFIHEAFGHLSEADNLLKSPALRNTMTLGTRFGSDILNVVDDPSLTGIPGHYVFDDEGVQGQKTYLIQNGLLTGRLHSRETAAETEENPTGHARAKDYNFTPIVRMGNIYIDKGPNTMEEMIASIDNGLYLFGAAGGQTAGEMFTFAVQGGYVIKNGQIREMVRDIALTGNLFTTLMNIEMIGNEVQYSKGGGCGKDGQILIASGKGSAPIKVKGMAIGGRT